MVLRQILTEFLVWFIYPETANIRLEDMNSVFGDGTSVMPTPQTLAEAESLFSRHRSPVPSMDLNRRAGLGADSAIPGLDIDPPDVPIKDGRPQIQRGNSEREGLGGWISNLTKKKSKSGSDAQSGSYRRLEQDED